MLLSSIIHAHSAELFAGREVSRYSQFRVTRDADLWIDEEEVKNLRQALQGELPAAPVRHAGAAGGRRQLPARTSRDFLLQQFELAERRPLPLRRAGQPRAARVD